MSVLDFYVEEEQQRCGIGKALFDGFLRATNANPICCSYDRPSPKLIAFLGKQYKITDVNIQPNKYAVTERFLWSISDKREKEKL